jgi:hypothetical protein
VIRRAVRGALGAGLLLVAGAWPAFAVQTPLPQHATWRYRADGVNLGTSWIPAAYVDSAWAQGPGVLGFGEAYIVTPVPMGTPRYTTTYFRTTFLLPDDAATITALTLAATYDDGFVAWLNGQELTRRGLPAGPVSYSQFATNHEAAGYESIDVTALRALLVPGPNVLAVEVHQTSGTSSDLVWDCELTYATALTPPDVTRGPYLADGTSDAVTVRWRTNVATDSRVWVGAAPGALAPAVSDGALTTEHELRLTGLTPETRNYYAVGTSTGILSGDDSLTWVTTGPPAGESRPTRIWVLGDSGLPGPPQSRVRDAYTAFAAGAPTDVWLMLGDNAYEAGTDADFTNGVFTPYASFLRTHVLWPTRGNHDAVYAGGVNDYYDFFTLPTSGEAGGLPSASEAYYSFDHGDIHFICLDSEGTDRSAGGAMLTWLANDLAATNRTWIIAFWHHPPYTKGSHDSDDIVDSGGRMSDMRQNAMPVLEAGGVDLVLNGHSHSYERSFLIDGHDGTSGTLTPAMIKDAGDGRRGGDGAYAKASPTPAAHEGEVVAVAGSSAQTSGGSLDHPAMAFSLNALGSLVIDVHGLELDGVFLDDLGAVRDSFAIVKGPGVVVGTGGGRANPALALASAGANPFTDRAALQFTLPSPGRARISIVDPAGRRVRRVADDAFAAGTHRAAWDGADDLRHATAAGVYFAVLEFEGERRVVRLTRLH